MKLVIMDTTYELKETPNLTFLIAQKTAYPHFASATMNQGVVNEQGETLPLIEYKSIKIEGKFYRFLEVPKTPEIL
jgi:hypothetical protein